MPEPSAFTEIGLDDITSDPPLAETIYDALWASYGDNFARGGYKDASIYAQAMAFARALRCAQNVEAQRDNTRVLDLLPAREFELGLIPGPTASIADRRRAVAAADKLGVGCTFSNLYSALQDLLGADLVDVVPSSNTTTVPVSPFAVHAPGLFTSPSKPRYVYTLQNAFAGSTLSYWITNILPAFPGQPKMRIGDVVTLEPENVSVAEKVTVLSFADGGAGPSAMEVTRPANPHSYGALVLSQSWPYWTSPKRSIQVRVSVAVGKDPVKRAAIDLLLSRMLRAVTTWSVVSSTGPFTLDLSLMDTTCTT